jgi:hypothetical protein
MRKEMERKKDRKNRKMNEGKKKTREIKDRKEEVKKQLKTGKEEGKEQLKRGKKERTKKQREGRKERKERKKEAKDVEKNGKKRRRKRMKEKDYNPMYTRKTISTNIHCKLGKLFACLFVLHAPRKRTRQTSVLQILRFHSHRKDMYSDLNFSTFFFIKFSIGPINTGPLYCIYVRLRVPMIYIPYTHAYLYNNTTYSHYCNLSPCQTRRA